MTTRGGGPREGGNERGPTSQPFRGRGANHGGTAQSIPVAAGAIADAPRGRGAGRGIGFRGGDGAGPGGGDSVKPSDDPLFFPYTVGEVLGGKYILGGVIGSGTFSHVLAATHVTDSRVRVAIKVMKPLSTYIQYVCDAKKESQLLHFLKEAYKSERGSNAPMLCRSLHMEETIFLRRGDEDYVCLAFEHCDCTLYDLVRSNGFMGLHVGVVQSIALQCLQQLQRVHALGYTHTDIKHKNVMFVRENTLGITKREHWPVQVQGSASRSAVSYRHPVECFVRIIDYGNCTHESQSHNTTVHTKQFRAPEILLQCFPWTTASDLWCLGCTLYFAYNGDLLFNSHDRGQLVSMISAVLGGIPTHMLNGFNVQPVVGTVADLHSRIHPTHRVFADFILTLLCVDPAKRASAEEALKHPFFQTQF